MRGSQAVQWTLCGVKTQPRLQSEYAQKAKDGLHRKRIKVTHGYEKRESGGGGKEGRKEGKRSYEKRGSDCTHLRTRVTE